MATLLLELFSEEIPARMQRGAAEQLQRLITGGFEKAELAAKEVRTFVSPRHLAIELIGLPAMQKDVTEERKGPRVGAPEQAMKGFLGSVGLTAAQCEQRDGYYFATIHRKGRGTGEVAKEIIESALAAFVWPKSMRWGAGTQAWVRPLHRIACLLDSAIIPVQFAGLTAGNVTGGHRFLHRGDVVIHDAAQYMETLHKAHVSVDYATRRAQVQHEVEKLASLHNLTAVADETLLDEITGLVEWPMPLFGTFDKKFLELPKEVLISEMKVHQRYIALQDAKGNLSNHFIAVANIPSRDDGKRIAEGNARVLRARLSDGEFYWEQDRKKPLSGWAKGLSGVVFHAKVGMMSDKVKRIEKIAVKIAETIVGGMDVSQVTQAAQLCKADLTTGMVGEFPELQGIMGYYYAQSEQLPKDIAIAIRDHYKPAGATDTLPESRLAAIISIADKLDSILSLFAAGEKPTGSKDPFALRRAAIGIMRITLQERWNLDIAKFTSDPEIIEFFRDRLKNLLADELKHDVIEAALNIKEKTFVPNVITEQARNLAKWTASATDALAAIKRTLNILAAEEKKAKLSYSFIDSKLTALSEPAEKELLKALKSTKATKPADLNALAAPINTFFDKVLVNAEDKHVREARLSLLAGVREKANQIADFSKIEG